MGTIGLTQLRPPLLLPGAVRVQLPLTSAARRRSSPSSHSPANGALPVPNWPATEPKLGVGPGATALVDAGFERFAGLPLPLELRWRTFIVFP
jgi:hypothetical protein